MKLELGWNYKLNNSDRRNNSLTALWFHQEQGPRIRPMLLEDVSIGGYMAHAFVVVLRQAAYAGAQATQQETESGCRRRARGGSARISGFGWLLAGV